VIKVSRNFNHFT